MKYYSSQSGLTIIEALLVFGIIAVITVVVIVPFSTFRQRQSLQNSTNAIVSVLNEARTKTLAGVNNTYYSVRLESGQITLFAGGTYLSGANANQVTVLESPTTASWSLQGGGATISFDRLKGTTSQYGTITISLPNGTTKTVTVSSLGAIVRN